MRRKCRTHQPTSKLIIGAFALTILGVAAHEGLAQAALTGPAPVRHHGADKDLRELVVVKTTTGAGIVRFAAGPLERIAVGDQIGRNHALVKEIVPDRVVLEERFIAADGRPNIALIFIANGEKGGKRYLRRPEEERPTADRPVANDGTAKGKKP